jgi:hypothetical protein
MATRRCSCGVWFEYDALVRDEAVECPECGRILPREGRDKGQARSAASTLVWQAGILCCILAFGGVVGAIAFLRAEDAVAAIAFLLICVFLGGFLISGAATLRALAEAVDRLEDRIP